MEKVRILHATTDESIAYHFLRSWFQHMSGNDLDVVVACPVTEFAEDIEKTGASMIQLPITDGFSPVGDFLGLMKLYSYFKQEHFHCIHTHGPKAGFLVGLAARTHGVPLHIHTIHEMPHDLTESNLLNKYYTFYESIACKLAHQVITVSYANKEDIENKQFADMRRLEVIREGLNVSDYNITSDAEAKKAELNIPPGAPVVGTVGPLIVRSGHKYMLKAAQIILRENPDTHFVIVGEGKLRDKLVERAAYLEILDRISFVGFREDQYEVMKMFDVFLVPAVSIGLGFIIMEAMALGVPVVVSDVPGVKDLIIHNETGLKVPPRDSKGIADAVLNILSDRRKAESIKQNAREHVTQEFEDSVVNEKMMDLYRRLFQKHLKIDIFEPLF